MTAIRAYSPKIRARFSNLQKRWGDFSLIFQVFPECCEPWNKYMCLSGYKKSYFLKNFAYVLNDDPTDTDPST